MYPSWSQVWALKFAIMVSDIDYIDNGARDKRDGASEKND